MPRPVVATPQRGRRRSRIHAVARAAARLTLALFALSVSAVVVFRFVPVPLTPLMLLRAAEQARDERRVVRIEKKWVGSDAISPHLQHAVVCAEDQKFFEHHGFDVPAIRAALRHNRNSKRTRGASTITQQTAKNVFLWDGRTWLRKGLEAYFTVWLELLWSKERILAVYLNVIEFGDGIYGAEAAARRYFGKSAATLTADESALLAAVLPSPRARSVTAPSPYVRARQRWVLRQMTRCPTARTS
jgi:monofunctional biosynthetic peptidoglycan transglycosylase